VAFQVAARTILELGAELISSDVVAIYELVKNAIDARSRDGVTIEFCVTLAYTDYIDALTRIDVLVDRQKLPQGTLSAADRTEELKRIKETVISRVLTGSPPQHSRAIADAVAGSKTAAELRRNLVDAYTANNWIEFLIRFRRPRDVFASSYCLMAIVWIFLDSIEPFWNWLKPVQSAPTRFGTPRPGLKLSSGAASSERVPARGQAHSSGTDWLAFPHKRSRN
jgi:hypothetical protein